MIVATQGRGLWILDDLTVLHQLQKNENSPKLYTPKDVYRVAGRGGRSSLTEGTNLPNGAIVHYYLPEFDEKTDSLAISFHDTNGDEIKRFSNHDKKNKLTAKVGGNQLVWNMRYKGAERLKGMILWGASLAGAKAVPGIYQVQLHLNGETLSQDFEILPNPLAEATVAQMQEQFDFVNVVNQTIGGIIKNVRVDCLNCDSVKGIEQLGILTHSSNRVNGINQPAEVVSKVGGEKEANGRLGSPPKR